MPDNQNVSIWDNPMYAWQQQLASGANLAKNLNWQTLLGLNLGTILGSRLGNIVGNWQQESDFLQRMKNGLIDKGYSDVTYDKATRRFMGFDANGNTVYFGRNGEIIPQQPAATNYNPQNPPWQREGNFDLGWTPPQEKYTFPTANKLFTDAVTPTPSSFDWRQNLRRQQPFFPMRPTPQAPATPTQSTSATPTTTIPAPPQTPIPQVSPTVTQALYNPKQIYDAWRYNHLNNQPTTDRPFS